VRGVWARSQKQVGKLVWRAWRVGAEPETGRETRAACWRVGAEPETGRETRVACVACGRGVWRVWCVGAEPGKETRVACVACGRGVWREWRVGAEPETGKETRVACVACGSGVRRVGVWARSQVRKFVWHAWRVGSCVWRAYDCTVVLGTRRRGRVGSCVSCGIVRTRNRE